MTSIPYDPTLQLGQVIQLEKIQDLKDIAEAQKPLDLALAKLNNITKTSYKLKMIYSELENLEIEKEKLKPVDDELRKVKDKIATAAIEYGQTALKVLQDVEKLKLSHTQKKISVSVESPLDFSASEVKQFPLAFDSLTFDVQYVRNETNDQSDSSHAKQVAMMGSAGISGGIGVNAFSSSLSTASTLSSSVQQQTSSHKIEGTVVITANCTHKNADIIEPFRIDPEKAISAWNYTFPKDQIKTTPQDIFEAAIGDYKTPPSEKPALHILSGCTKGSSFVGLVHILQQEDSTSSNSAYAYSQSVQASMEFDMWATSLRGGYGSSSSRSASKNSMNSSSAVNCHCSILCRGLIPSIVASDVTTTIQKMDMDPETVMSQLSAITESSNAGVNSSMESQMEEGRKGGQFMSLNRDYMDNTVANISEQQTEANKVIDQNSMMTAFQDYVDKASAGESGVPINFYIKRLTKNDVAKSYIRRFYPTGILTPKDAQRGTLGQEPAGDEGGE
mmetsp:Transcript_37145/g.42384  ORF Transcript_37145/g.42384 Transcript_37145/m.42384 type:complete len:504 (-) Transcript_37145:35-1546(-)|eukprot:CAMPEP_0194169402 /NCGR_PEP_ID=MMETSP0154-20130528/4083_1 /TAXON_ID=1049557 /ORGANISM="Thalassiothrix antarctica, Strain L6-D1" /LENGTH=503 /DNA_ID=CAMNT_0038880785 /DNA_START=75 /DNA_END=1586 /DNA_ORIENTATION=+